MKHGEGGKSSHQFVPENENVVFCGNCLFVELFKIRIVRWPLRGVSIDFVAIEAVESLVVLIALPAVCSNELTCISHTLKTRFMFQELLNCAVDNELSNCKTTKKPHFILINL